MVYNEWSVMNWSVTNVVYYDWSVMNVVYYDWSVMNVVYYEWSVMNWSLLKGSGLPHPRNPTSSCYLLVAGARRCVCVTSRALLQSPCVIPRDCQIRFDSFVYFPIT